ncbi:MAG TPA: cytochrome c biogenesis protein CcdA [Solirubrobacteraceae bacterium]|jgi:cytochrome c biogenesis protein CcdA/thiol-disulfide isomerase/thioredoxin|nr:cytochrome c biogenesis protein CcdA [Solirubrobacteraceae bacterium]
MLILMFFALLAGAGTALSPCVLPVLPALLSAGGVGGRRRPLGIVLGLTVTFTITIVGISKVAGGVGLGSDPLRDLAVVVLLGFGIALLVPSLARRIEEPLAFLSRFGPRTRGDGFASGLVVGGALGFVYTPCAGPILAAVIAVSAASGRSIAVGLSYALGSAIVLFALSLGGRRVIDRLRAAGRGPQVQRTLGVVMILTAVVIVTQLDVRLDQQIAEHIPQVSLTASLESSHAVTSRIAGSLRTRTSPFTSDAAQAASAAPALPTAAAASSLPDLGPAPEFVGTQRWFNTPGGAPLSLAGLRGRVVLIDFWTYTCINCLRTLPYLEAWNSKYAADGLTIVGIEAPEFAFEKDASNVANAIGTLGIKYPVVQDNNMDTWNAWGNQYWPAEFLIDASGQVRSADFGEGDYAQTEAKIRSLLAATGHTALGADARAVGAITPSQQATPETYLGYERADGWIPANPKPGTHTTPAATGSLPLSRFSYGGTWTIGPQEVIAGANARIDTEVEGKNVYIVLSPPKPGTTGHVGVTLDGRPAPDGVDVHNGSIAVTGQRLYTVASFAKDGPHRLTLKFSPGTEGFSFTFG